MQVQKDPGAHIPMHNKGLRRTSPEPISFTQVAARARGVSGRLARPSRRRPHRGTCGFSIRPFDGKLWRLSPWRNWIARRFPEPKVPGSSPGGDGQALVPLLLSSDPAHAPPHHLYSRPHAAGNCPRQSSFVRQGATGSLPASAHRTQARTGGQAAGGTPR